MSQVSSSVSSPSPWLGADFAQTYAVEAADPVKSWYELEVNEPAAVKLVPENAKHILDFGCGPGLFTEVLARQFPDARVEGCDSSPAMLELARVHHPSSDYFLWDGTLPVPANRGPYDVVVSKLVVHFVEDLTAFARSIFNGLEPRGALVISMPHPTYTVRNVHNYWRSQAYRQQIGSYGIFDEVIHRSLEEYITTFTHAGFVLTDITEPEPSEKQLVDHHVEATDFSIPKRLNLRFVKWVDKGAN